MMPDFVKVAKADSVKPGSVIAVEIGGKTLALCNAEGRFYALDNTCLHRGGPIGEGFLDGNIVTCPWHAWQYDVTSGQNTANPSVRLTCHRTKVEGEDVFIEI